MRAADTANRNRTHAHAARLNDPDFPALEALESRVLFAGGDLDALFGVGGIVSLDLLGGSDLGLSVAVQSDSKIVVAGSVASGTSAGTDLAVVRYNADGTLDTTFGGGDGIVITDLGTTSDAAFAVALQADGKIVVGGRTRSSMTSTDVAVVRYNADGTIDKSFGYGGFNGTDLNRTPDVASAMTLTADGRIVIVGSTVVAGQTQVMAVRYTSAGMQDSSFGAGGVKVVSYSGGTSEARSVAALSDGRLLIGGTLLNGAASGSDFAAVRLLANGTLDTAFGTSGWSRIDLGGDMESATAMAVQSDGRIVLAGSSRRSDGMSDFGLVRLAASGQLDGSFGVGGLVIADLAGGNDSASAIVLQSNGKIFVAGTASVNGVDHLAIARFRVNGALDAGFGGTGLVLVGTGFAARGSAITLDHEQRVVVAGHVDNGLNSDLLVARLLSPPNIAPIAHAGGVYSVLAGLALTLSGAASSDPDGVELTYEWDLNYDGASFNCDCAGVAPVFTASTSGVCVVALRVTDADGASHTVTTTITVLAPPTAHAGGAYSLEAGASTMLNGSGSSDADGSIVTYEWDLNYDGSTFQVDASGAAPTFSAAGLSAGVYTVALRVTDDDGNTHLATTTVTVVAPPPPPPPVEVPPPTSPARLVDDPEQAGRKMLVVNGSTRSDRIRFQQVKKGVEVRVGRQSLGVFSGMTRIVVHGGRGNDTIDASKVRVPVVLFGGVGNDHLKGSLFSDVLVGEDGNDHLDGNQGDDLLIGGAGRDHLHSRQGRDLLVGGMLKVGHALQSVREVLSDWNSPLPAKAKGYKGIFAMLSRAMPSLPAAVDDNVGDMLHCTPGDDGILAGKHDKIQKLRK